MKIYNSPNMGKYENGGRRGILKSAVAGLAALGLANCSEAEGGQQAEEVRVAELTQADCLALEVETEAMSCLRDVSDRESAERQAEIASRRSQREANAAEIAAGQATGQQLDTTIEVLSVEAAAARERLEARILGDPDDN